MKNCSRNLVLLLGVALLTTLGCDDDDPPKSAADVGIEDVTSEADATPSDAATDVGTSDVAAPDVDAGPQPDLDLPGLTARVKVSFDAQGVLHIECAADLDCITAQGYYHAAHRFAQMDLRRRNLRGELAAAVGALGLDSDKARRHLFTTRDGQPLEEAMWQAASPAVRAWVEAYTVGVNAWLDDYRNGRNGADLSDEYKFPAIESDNIRDWEPEDSVIQVFGLIELLSNNSGTKIALGEAYSKMTPEAAFDILGSMSATSSTTMGSAGEAYPHALRRPVDARRLRAAQERMAPLGGLFEQARQNYGAILNTGDLNGSNSWAVGPSRTTSGKAILTNDPHLGLSNPALWYLVRLDSKSKGQGDLHVAGVSFAGLPGIVLGHNEHVAWGATVAYYDLVDVYVETLNAAGTAVIFNGAEVPILIKEFTFQVGAGTQTAQFRYVPHHGPVIAFDAAAGTALTLRWRGQDARTDLDFIVGLSHATTIAEASEALKLASATNQNWTVIDRDDNIGWFPFTHVPQRPWASLDLPPWLPLPGDGSAEWGAPIPFDELPQLLNPAAGFIATANQDMTGAFADGDPTNDGYPMMQSSVLANGFRHQRIVDLIEAGANAHDSASMLAILGDDYSMLAAGIVPVVLEEAAGLELAAPAGRVVTALTGWQYTCPTGLDGHRPNSPKSSDLTATRESVGCAAFHVLLAQLGRATFGDELRGTGFSPAGGLALRTLYIAMTRPEALVGGDVYWNNVTTDFDETRGHVIADALAAAAGLLEELAGTDSDDWRWGKLHQVSMGAPLLELFVPIYDLAPRPAPGGQFTVNPANPRAPLSGDFHYTHGASMRMIVENTDAGFRSWFQLPGGQRHFRDSEFYDNLLDPYLENKPFEMALSPEALAPQASETITVAPR